MKRLAFALSALTLSLAACGFQPVYAPSAGKLVQGSITIGEIPGRSGYMLRRALNQELAAGLPGIDGPAELQIKLQEDLTRLIFTPDGAASRSTVIAKSNYELIFGEKTLTGSVGAEASFAVPDGPYGDISAQTSASDRAMRQLARRIVDDLRLKLATG